jgi:POT family proton-dependent oligopeptide transporter
MSQTVSKHPKGLWVLFLTEMWERFGYYLMLGIFTLYMLDSWDKGGMGFSAAEKSDIFGTYIGLVYLTPFIGGLLADRLLGYRLSIMIGGVLMAAGYFCLAIHSEVTFYLALLLIIVGNGFFKPNISTLVGNLYNDDRYKDNKDSGFNIFYMGINIGAFVCNFVAAYLRNTYGWGAAFSAAGVGMVLGIIIFMIGTKHVKEADVIKPTKPGDMSLGRIFGAVLLPMFVFGFLGYIIPGNIFGSDTTDGFVIGCLPVVGFFIYLLVTANEEDKRPIAALLSVYACIVIFWAVFHQNGDALTVWANDYTEREAPESIRPVVKFMGADEVVSYTSAAQMLSKKDNDHLLEELTKQAEDAKKAKDTVKYHALEAEIVKQMEWKYFSNRVDKVQPGTEVTLVSTEIFQSVNPGFVVLLTPVIVGLFGFMRRKGNEPSTPTKIFLGLVITALSTLVMFAAVKATDVNGEKASALWLIASYAVITAGELCLSPMGLSLVSKLSPPRITALMMGGFFLSTSLGNKLAGVLSGMWEGFEDKGNFFLMNFGLVMVAAVLLLVMLRWLNSVMKEKNIQ